MKKLSILIIAVTGLVLGMLSSYISPIILVAAFMSGIIFLVLILDYQKSLYVLALYVFIDYFLRDILKLSLLSSFWDEIFIIVAVFLFIYKTVINRHSPSYRHTPVDFPLIFFFVTSLFLFIFNSPNMRISLDGLRAVIQYMFWFFAVVQLLRTQKGADRMYLILTISGAILAVHGIFQYIIGVEMPSNWVDIAEKSVRTRVYSITGNPNALGSMLVMLAPMALGLYLNEKHNQLKLLYLVCTAVMSISIILTFSRGAWMGMLLGIIVFVGAKDKRLLLPLIAGTVVIFAAIPSVADRILYMISPEYMQSSSRGGRLGRWEKGLEILRSKPWLGVGLGHFGGAVAHNNEIPGTFYMDNYYLKTAVEMGIIGLGAFLFLITSAIAWCYRAYVRIVNPASKNLVLGAFAGLLGVLAHNLVENVFEIPMMSTYFWMLVGYIMFTSIISNSNTDEKNSPFTQ